MKTSWVAAVVATAVLGGCTTNFLQYQSAVVRDQEKKVREATLKNEIAIDQAKNCPSTISSSTRPAMSGGAIA